MQGMVINAGAPIKAGEKLRRGAVVCVRDGKVFLWSDGEHIAGVSLAAYMRGDDVDYAVKGSVFVGFGLAPGSWIIPVNGGGVATSPEDWGLGRSVADGRVILNIRQKDAGTPVPPEPPPMSPLDVPGLSVPFAIDCTDPNNLRKLGGGVPADGDSVEAVKNVGSVGGWLEHTGAVAGNHVWHAAGYLVSDGSELSATGLTYTGKLNTVGGVSTAGKSTGGLACRDSDTGYAAGLFPGQFAAYTGGAQTTIYTAKQAAEWQASPPRTACVASGNMAWGEGEFSKVYSFSPPPTNPAAWPEDVFLADFAGRDAEFAIVDSDTLQYIRYAFLGYKQGGLTLEETRAVNAWLRQI